MNTEPRSAGNHRTISSLKRGIEPNYLVTLAVTGLIVQALFAWRIIGADRRPPMTRDAALFEHGGWYIANGAAMYHDIWDPKPPLAFEIPGVLAVITDNLYALHLLNVALMCIAAIGSMVLVGLLTKHLTGDSSAATVAGLAMLVLPGILVRTTLGFKAKYLVIAFGLLAVSLALHRYPFWSGLVAAASTGVWQIAIIFPLVVFGIVLDRDERDQVLRVIAGVTVMVVVMLIPVIKWGVVEAMIVQAGIAPFLLPEEFSIPVRLYWGVMHFKYGSVFVLLGVLGMYRFARSGILRRDWWVLAFAGYFGAIVFFVDFDIWGYMDLVPGLPFVAIGVGVLYASLDRETYRALLAAGLAVVIVINVAFFGSFGVLFAPVETPESSADVQPTTTMNGKMVGYDPLRLSSPMCGISTGTGSSRRTATRGTRSMS